MGNSFSGSVGVKTQPKTLTVETPFIGGDPDCTRCTIQVHRADVENEPTVVEIRFIVKHYERSGCSDAPTRVEQRSFVHDFEPDNVAQISDALDDYRRLFNEERRRCDPDVDDPAFRARQRWQGSVWFDEAKSYGYTWAEATREEREKYETGEWYCIGPMRGNPGDEPLAWRPNVDNDKRWLHCHLRALAYMFEFTDLQERSYLDNASVRIVEQGNE